MEPLAHSEVNPDHPLPPLKFSAVSCGLQAHFQRTNLSGDLATDQARVLSTTVRLLQAAVDVITSSSWLNPAITAMELSQMVVQAMWQTDSVLLQLPHFTRDLAKKCTQANISTIIAGQEEGSSLADMEVSMLCLINIGFSRCALCCTVFHGVVSVHGYANHYLQQSWLLVARCPLLMLHMDTWLVVRITKDRMLCKLCAAAYLLIF